MPPKREVEVEFLGQAPNKKRKMPEKDSDEYKRRREKNNEAVKRSRDKTRQRYKETMDKVSKLREENVRLEQKVQILTKELQILRDLFRAHAGVDTPVVPSSANVIAVQKDHGEYTIVTVKSESDGET